MRTTLKTWIMAHRVLSILVLGILIGVLALVLVAVGLRLAAPSATDADRVAASSAAPSSPAPADSPAAPDEIGGPAGSATEPTTAPGATIVQAADPDVFARSVAGALFAWDTTSTSLPDVTEQLLTVADPTGEETPGLLSDLRTYLPGQRAWTHLGRYQTRQWLEVTDVVEPAAWREALAQAPDGAVAEGTTARTVTGMRHRAGTWDGQPITTSSRVQFTVFLVCGPAYERCLLLRLSSPDTALL